MISEEKMIHIVHLMLDGLEKAGMLDFPNKDLAVREAKRIGLQFINEMNTIGEVVRKRISSQKSPPLEHSPQWEILYQKYYEEEVRKKGG